MPGINTASDTTFFTDKVHVGLRARVSAAAGLWHNVVRSKATLTGAHLQDAINLMASFKNDKGQPLPGQAAYLFIKAGGTLEAAAEALINAQFEAGGANNIYYKRLQLIKTKYL
jgi:phage major head subunit gpT-like protein